MDLYSYVSIESFVRGCKESKTPGTFTLHVPNLLYAKSDEIIGYGLSLLRRSIVLHEEQKGIGPELSKQNIPFFRENRRMLIGPEVEMYALSLYQNLEIPSGVKEKDTSCLRLTFDYGALGEYSLSEEKYLLRCKYNEEENLNAFVSQMRREYDKFFYDEEHTGFKRDSRFFSMLCNACLDILCQSALISDHTHAHMIFLRRLDTGLHIIAQQCHQCIHFILAALPVLRGKSIDRQVFNPHIICFFTDSLHIFCPLDMSVITGHSFCLCPPSVAIQNNGYMLRNLHVISSSTFP